MTPVPTAGRQCSLGSTTTTNRFKGRPFVGAPSGITVDFEGTSRMPLVLLKPVLFQPMLFQRVFSPFAGVPLVLFKPVLFKPVPFVARIPLVLFKSVLLKPVLFQRAPFAGVPFAGAAPFKGATSLTP